MKIVIHMGLHKTGSTSFQNFLSLNKLVLMDAGILYPNIDNNEESHWIIPNQIILENWTYLENYFKEIILIANKNNLKTIFISSEDISILLTESYRVNKFENLITRLGIAEIELFCVLRNQWDYFNSLYAEMSKHKVCLNYASAGEEIINFGQISMGNDRFRYRFAFDYDYFIDKFLGETKGSFSAISYESFISNKFIGKELINTYIDSDKKTKFWLSNLIKSEKINSRPDADTIEIDYLANFLGISMTNEIFENNQNSFVPIIQNRHGMIDLVSKDLNNRFLERFPIVSNFL